MLIRIFIVILLVGCVAFKEEYSAYLLKSVLYGGVPTKIYFDPYKPSASISIGKSNIIVRSNSIQRIGPRVGGFIFVSLQSELNIDARSANVLWREGVRQQVDFFRSKDCWAKKEDPFVYPDNVNGDSRCLILKFMSVDGSSGFDIRGVEINGRELVLSLALDYFYQTTH